MNKPILLELEDGEIVHAYGCLCERCMKIFKAITAQTEDGEYFFSDDELRQLFEKEE